MNIHRSAIVLVVVAVIAALAACKKEEGACVITVSTGSQSCMMATKFACEPSGKFVGGDCKSLGFTKKNGESWTKD
jgi:hypothetical protein